jgi:hypothetical protein
MEKGDLVLKLTISSLDSPIFFPISLFIQSFVLPLPSFDIRPGTTRGIVVEAWGVVQVIVGIWNVVAVMVVNIQNLFSLSKKCSK